MRKNSRWANTSSYVGGRRPSAGQKSLRSGSFSGDNTSNYAHDDGHPGREGNEEDLMAGFVELRRKLAESEGMWDWHSKTKVHVDACVEMVSPG